MAILFTGHKLHFIVDSISDASAGWEDGSMIWVAGESCMYIMQSGVAICSTGWTITNPSRALNTAYQPSTTKQTDVRVNCKIASTLNLGGGQSGSVYLETSPDNSNWTTRKEFTNNNTGTLTIGLNTTQTISNELSYITPIGCYYRIRTSGTSTFTLLYTTEITF